MKLIYPAIFTPYDEDGEKGYVVVFPDLPGCSTGGDSLGEALAQRLDGGENILIPRASKGNANLVKILMERGAQVDDIPTYDTVYEKNPLIDVAAEIKAGGIDCVVFTSASTVKGFVEGTPGLDYTKVKLHVSENRRKLRQMHMG